MKKKQLKNSFETVKKGIYAGVMIGIGGTIYLAVPNKIVGAFLFSFGLLTICMYQLNLYTGKVGYLLQNKKSYLLELLLSLFGNFLGTFFVGILIRMTRYSAYIETAKGIVNLKLADNPLSIFILSFFCGILMFLAVNNFKTSKDEIGKYIGIFMGVMIFILAGFEHCVANLFYFTTADIFNFKVLLYFLIMVLGNSVGSIFISFCNSKKK